MTFLEIMDIASSLARFSMGVAVIFVAAYASHTWHKGNERKAIYLIGWAVLLSTLSGK